MKVYLSEPIALSALERLKSDFEIIDTFDQPEQIDAIISRNLKLPGSLIRNCKNLKVISYHGVGVDGIDLDTTKELGIPVKNVPGQNAASVAELAVTMLLALSRKLKSNSQGLEQGRFTQFGQKEMVSNETFGKKLGLIGSGTIATITANIMKTAFNNEIYCYNPHKSKTELAEKGFIKIDNLNELFSKMDFVSLHLPYSEESKNMINMQILSSANPHLFLINTSRGGIVNEKDLYDALISGKIQGAAMDVFEKEPPNKNHPLLNLDNFIGTFHVAATTVEALERVGNATVDNIYKGIREWEEIHHK